MARNKEGKNFVKTLKVNPLIVTDRNPFDELIAGVKGSRKEEVKKVEEARNILYKLQKYGGYTGNPYDEKLEIS